MEGLIVGIIGCGNMGSAIARGMVDRGIASGDSIFLYDKDIKKAAQLAEKTGCVQKDLSQLVRSSDFLVIAVKPQDFDVLAGEIAGDIAEQTIVSVMAGIGISAITGKLGRELPVVRAMPNMAAFVGESITCISCSGMVNNTEKVKNIFSGIGKVLELDEKLLDGATALSGSGPAYLFYLAEAMIDAAREAGFDEVTAKELVVQTLYGSAALLKGTGSSPEDLIRKVASKGGTTEAALSVFDEKDLKSHIKAAILKAKQRSEELSRG
ncbi:MAG: pyrroline-5-carboxylate reductase [Candidatus Omnitrophota bacterium]